MFKWPHGWLFRHWIPPHWPKQLCLHASPSIVSLFPLFLGLRAPSPDKHHTVACSTSQHSSRSLNSCTAPAPLSSGPSQILASSHFLLLWLPKKLKDNQDGGYERAGWQGCSCGAWAQCHRRVPRGGVGDKMPHAARWMVGQPRKIREVEATHRPMCKHEYSGQCGGIRIRYLNGSTTTRSLEHYYILWRL
jgi:hypothetical protein